MTSYYVAVIKALRDLNIHVPQDLCCFLLVVVEGQAEQAVCLEPTQTKAHNNNNKMTHHDLT